MIVISPKRIIRYLIVIILCLSSVNLLINFFRCFLGYGRLFGISRLFDLDGENNIPAWYSSISLLTCAILLAIITSLKARQGDRFVKYWGGLSLMFLWISMDEASSIHELLIPLGNALKTDGFLKFFWVVPAAFLLVVIGFSYRKFLRALPKRIRRLFLAAASIYITGALVMEMVGGKFIQVFSIEIPIANNSGLPGMMMAFIIFLEEGLEMLGVAVFLYALLVYLSRETGVFQLSVGDFQIQVSSEKNLSMYPGTLSSTAQLASVPGDGDAELEH